jgi:hypothetical protein
MPLYRKKPVLVEARKADGTPQCNVSMIAWTYGSKTPAFIDMHPKHGVMLAIKVLEGKFWVSPGDYVIKGLHGEFYPCKPDVFEETYEFMGE